MKSITFLLVFCLVVFTGCKTSRPIAEVNTSVSQKPESMTDNTHKDANFSEQSTWLLGYFNPVQLKREPHSVWFYNGYDGYRPNAETLNSLNGIDREGVTIKIVLGTWCPDSRREVPRFMKVIDIWNFPSDLLTFIGVDNEKNSPIGGYEELNIQRVPTFIIYKNNIETGRIIENPVTSLEQDMVGILGGIKNTK